MAANVILALDISSVSTGWAVLVDGQPAPDAYGLIHSDKKQSEGARLVYFQNEIVKLIDRFKPTDIITEDIFKGFNIVSFKVLAQYRGVALKTIYEQTNKEAESMLAVTARTLVGVGIKKEQAFEGIIKKYKLKGDFDFERDNDFIDAYCLGFALIELRKGNVDAKSIRNVRRRKKRRRKPNKKRVSKAGTRKTS
jgi:Holliday junction resolvasome RuvABC endonuclease subunit